MNTLQIFAYWDIQYANLSLQLYAHMSVWSDMCNKNKMSLDNLGLRAVNILELIRLRFHRLVAVPGSQPEKCCQETNLRSQFTVGFTEHV